MFAFIGQALIGWLLADLIGGVVHWLQDRVITDRWPLLQGVLRDNRLHHAEPMAFTRTSAWSRNAGTVTLALGLGAIWYLVLGPSIVLAFAVAGGVMSNEIHYQAHVRHGRLVRVLQDIGIIQSARVHAAHHRPPENTRYCILTDWLNPALDDLQVWRRLERLVLPAARES